ncbi:MAG: valine--tRNA ligase, partial [Desulfatitalea sp.]|nr:valine--tRNA ligase [Desulfatitalea sp.]
LQVAIQTDDRQLRAMVESHQAMITNLARLAHLSVQNERQRSPTAATAIVADAVMLVELKGVIDFSQETQRLEKEMGKLNKELTAINKKLNNDSFLSKAPAAVVDEVRKKQTALSEKQEKLTATLERVRSFLST